MPLYHVYGGRLDADLAFPELPAIPVVPLPADWRLRSRSAPAPERPLELLGEEDVTTGTVVRLFRHPEGYRLRYDDTGTFDVLAAGTEIRRYRRRGASLDAVRIDVLGRVLATALHASGRLCLHGSAVGLGGQGIGFVAPKYHGKSTLALALSNAGATVVTDDTIPIELGPPVMLRPGVPALRLWRDALDGLVADRRAAHRVGEKFLLHGIDDRRVETHFTPLSAIYLLTPVTARPDAAAATRVRFSPTEAALVLMRHAKIGALLGGSERGVLLAQAAEVAQRVPVYALRIARALHRIGEVVETLGAWHGETASLRRVGT